MSEINVPKLRFGEFEGVWVEKRLGDLGHFKNGLNKSKEDFGHGFPFVNLMDVFGKSTILKDDFGLVNANKKDLELYALKKGDVLFIRSSVKKEGVGETALILNDLLNTTYSGFLIRFREKNNDFDILYKKYCFKTKRFRNSLLSLSTTSANTNINQESLNLLKIYLPQKPEQQKIANFLTSIDQKIEQLTKKEKLVVAYKKGVMQKIFSQEIRFRDENGEVYGDWVERKLGEIATFSKGKGISKSDIIENGTIECIRYGELYTIYNEVISEVKSKTNLDKNNLVLSQYNDVIIPASGETQIDIATASCILKNDVALSGDLNIIRSNENGIFLVYYLNSKMKFDIAKLSQGISVVHLYSSQLKSLKINLPSLKEQTKIANFLSSIDKKIEQVNRQIEESKGFKKGLLQEMFV